MAPIAVGRGTDAEELAAALPLRRPAHPSEVAETARFLLSDRSSCTTGTAAVVDGGRIL